MYFCVVKWRVARVGETSSGERGKYRGDVDVDAYEHLNEYSRCLCMYVTPKHFSK